MTVGDLPSIHSHKSRDIGTDAVCFYRRGKTGTEQLCR